MSLRVATVVLGAGQGARMGGPKALLAWRIPGETDELPLAAAHVAVRLAAESSEVVVVVREATRTRLLPWLPSGRAGVVLLVSYAPDSLGPAGSLARAAQWLAAHRHGELAPDVILVTPVDCLPVGPSVANALVDSLASDGALLAARPSYGGRRGHPVALRAEALAPYLGTEPPVLRDRLAALGRAVRDVPIDDPSVLADLNRAEHLAALGSGPPRFLGR